ncbi:MAG: serine/threonine-protein kinase [Nocardioides sp.]
MTQPTDRSWGLRDGDRLTDDLTAVKLLGGGTAYEAYLCFDDVTYAPVVVKVLRPDKVRRVAPFRGLRREVRALTAINHPVVVRGLRHDLDADRPHVVLEHIDGPRLSTLARRHGPLQQQQYVPLAIEIASALHYLRRVGYVHLDIKPSNVIMGAPARLIDLSVARPLAEAETLAKPIGTYAFMAPEQCGPPATGVPGYASDVWGLGATVFYAVAGRRPFESARREPGGSVNRSPQLGSAPPTLPDGVPGDVAGAIYAALERRPEDRPTPAEFAESLEPVLDRQPRAKLGGLRMVR